MSAGKHHDVLATTCIKFLTLVVGKQIHRDLFGAEETLTEIVKNIAIPNVTVRPADEECFEVGWGGKFTVFCRQAGMPAMS